MKKILLSVALLAVAAVAVVAGTSAWFTDKAVVDNNTFAAGKLDFKLNGDMTETQSLNLGPMEPGKWFGPYKMLVYNQNTPVSTMAMKYRFYDKYESETVGGFYNKLNVRAVHGFCDPSYEGGVNPTKTEETELKDLNWDSTTDSISGDLDVNITHCFALYFQLDPSAGNELQGASAVADIVVDGTQVANPGWTE